ncbi:MAG: exosortase-associated protein EpsI, B-type [Rhodospirillaceae bacterium]
MGRNSTWYSPRHLILALILLAGAGLAVAMKPTERMAQRRPPIDLEAAIPTTFGGWRIDTTLAPITVSPDVQAELDKIYTQTVSRTYINGNGDRVMLAVAYGGDQSRATQVHKPEVCYPMQGFQISNMTAGALDTLAGRIPIMRMVATQGQRVEPITYWIAVGDTVVRGALEQNLARLKYGLTGTVPDGILVRVSTISRNADASYALQKQFIDSMLAAMPPEQAARLIGRFSTAAQG